MTAVLKITDGTTVINLLGIADGYDVIGWRQPIAGYKGGGSWKNSPVGDGRQLGFKAFDNLHSVFPIVAAALLKQDVAAWALADLLKLCEKAADYWTDEWRTEPVWIVSQASCETSARYSTVRYAHIPNLSDIYDPSFNDAAILTDLQLQVEHGHWQGHAPGSSDTLELSAVKSFNSVNYGNVDSSGDRDPVTSWDVWFTNMSAHGNITHIFHWSAANGFSANLVGGALPFDLLDDVGAAPQVNDYIVFICDTSVTGASPFNSLVFDVGTVGAGYTGHWEYWNGAWVNLTAEDGTSTFTTAWDKAGVNAVLWEPPTDWVAPLINGITGYPVRYILDTVPGPLTTPAQQNRVVYAINWPFIEVQAGEITGDLPALAQLQSWGGSAAMNAKKTWIGARSVNRGDSFVSFLNAGPQVAGYGSGNPAGVTTNYSAGTSPSTYSRAPTGVRAFYNPAGVEAMARRVGWTFDETVSYQWFGVYHAFLRVKRTGGAESDSRLKISVDISSALTVFETDTLTISNTDEFHVLDFGRIDIFSGFLESGDQVDDMRIHVQADCAVAAAMPDIYIYDLCLLPIDERVWSFDDLVRSLGSPGGVLDIDSVTMPKRLVRALGRRVNTLEIFNVYQSVAPTPFTIVNDDRVRLWMFTNGEYSGDERSKPSVAIRNRGYFTPRYLALRGSG